MKKPKPETPAIDFQFVDVSGAPIDRTDLRAAGDAHVQQIIAMIAHNARKSRIIPTE